MGDLDFSSIDFEHDPSKITASRKPLVSIIVVDNFNIPYMFCSMLKIVLSSKRLQMKFDYFRTAVSSGPLFGA